MADKVDLTRLTRGEVDGNGVFDELMRTVNTHLHQEFKKERLTGSEYAQVYLGSLQSVLQVSLEYILQSGINARQEELLANQAAKVLRDIDLVMSQAALADAERAGALIRNDNLTKQGLQMDKELEKLVQELSLMELDETIKTKQAAKLDKEMDVLAQRKLTEEAQTKDTLSDGTAVAGSVGKQKELLSRQAEGFIRDSEQKAVKMLLDSWAIQRTTDNGLAPPSSVSNANIDTAVTKLLAGIGV